MSCDGFAQRKPKEAMAPDEGKKTDRDIALNGPPSQSYGASLAIWDHTVLPATRHK